jgi:hypothetical protein
MAHPHYELGDEYLTEHVGDESPDDQTQAEGRGPDEAYRHDPAVAVMAARLADSAFEAAARSWDVNECMRALAAQEGLDPDGPLGRELFQVASYRLRLDHGGKAGCALRSSLDTEHYAWPPRISEVESDVIALWRDVAGLVENLAAIARFHDLLFERRDGRRDEHATAAVQGYLAVARSRSRADLDVAAFLVRAWDLARSVGLWSLLADVQSELQRQARDAMSSGGAALPGVVLPMIAALAAPVPRRQPPASVPAPAAVDLLLETAFTTFRAGFLASQVAAMMRARASDPVAIEQINRQEVAAHRAEAAASAGLARQAHLADAIEIARARGLTDLVREVTAELQAIPFRDLGLRRHSTSVRVPADQVERFLHDFTASPEWRDGLRFFLSTDCPTGDLAQLRQQAHDLARIAPLVSVIPLGLLGDDGLPRWTAQSPEEQEAGRMATCARIRAELQGRHLAQGLHRLAERYGVPDEPSLMAFLSENGQSDSVLAASLARAFLHFWRGDYEACAHVAVPKIEAAARMLLRELDEGIYKLQMGKDQGQYPMLYSLLKELEKLAMDESWTYFLRWLLLAPPGMNIRNDLAHGFTRGISPVYAALILRAAAMLITVTAPQPPSAAHVAAADQPADLAPLPHRDRDDILGLLSHPVPSQVPAPWRDGLAGRAAGITATALRATASVLQLAARRLEP